MKKGTTDVMEIREEFMDDVGRMSSEIASLRQEFEQKAIDTSAWANATIDAKRSEGEFLRVSGELREEKAVSARRLEILRELEWSSSVSTDDGPLESCPSCHRYECGLHHDFDCDLANEIGGHLDIEEDDDPMGLDE